MRKFFFITALFLSVVLYSPAAAFEGPLQLKNQFPLFLSLDPPYLESASTENAFYAGLSHSSVFMTRHSSEWSFNLDMEITELAFRYKKDFPGLFEMGLEVPFISFESGFMDSFLESYHNTFGFPDYGRSSRPENKFLYEVRRNGVTVIKGKNGKIGIGDIRLSAKKVLLGGDPVVSIKADLELPTGEASRGFGNGSLDAGLSLLADKKISDKFMTYVNTGVIFPGDLKAEERISLRTAWFAGAGIEAALWKNLGLLGQILFQSSPYPKTGVGAIDRISALLSFGGRYSCGRNSLEFSLTEDPNTAGAPDVTFNLSYKRGL